MERQVASAWRTFYRGVWDNYGITPEQYRDLYVAQHGCCYICRTAKGMHPDDPKGRGGRRLGVDHNHMRHGADAVRGLLCTGSQDPKTCNRLIAFYNVHQLKRAVEYLEREPAQTVIRWGRFAKPELEQAKRDEIVRGILGLK